MSSKLIRFTDQVSRLLRKPVLGELVPLLEQVDDGYVDWVIAMIHDLRVHLDRMYWQLLDVLHEVQGITAELDIAESEMTDYRVYAQAEFKNENLIRLAAVVDRDILQQ